MSGTPDDFNRAELGKGWHVNTGEWKIVDGVLRVKEIKADKHSAAARRAIVTQDAVYEFRFRFVSEGKGFHFGFDPAPGELKKKGHLFSVIVAPDSWRIIKHIDKAKPKEDPNEILATAKAALDAGISRVIIGTAAVESDLAQVLCETLGPEQVMVSVDARDGYVALRGWTEDSRMPVLELVRRLEDMGLQRFMYTDVTRDGTLTEPNFAAIEELTATTHMRLLAAGGISAIAHLERLSSLGVEGAIVGKAVYTGDIDLAKAVEALNPKIA